MSIQQIGNCIYFFNFLSCRAYKAPMITVDPPLPFFKEKELGGYEDQTKLAFSILNS